MLLVHDFFVFIEWLIDLSSIWSDAYCHNVKFFIFIEHFIIIKLYKLYKHNKTEINKQCQLNNVCTYVWDHKVDYLSRLQLQSFPFLCCISLVLLQLLENRTICQTSFYFSSRKILLHFRKEICRLAFYTYFWKDILKCWYFAVVFKCSCYFVIFLVLKTFSECTVSLSLFFESLTLHTKLIMWPCC